MNTSSLSNAMPDNEPRSRLLSVMLWGSVLIAVAAVVRRLAALVTPAQSVRPPLINLDHEFAAHRALTLAHIVPALAFVLLAPIALLRTRPNSLTPLLLALGTWVGITAYAMNGFAVGGRVEQSAVLVFNTLFLYWLWRAWFRAKSGDPAGSRRSFIRAVAILLGIATTRPVMGVFFATSRLTGLEPNQLFGIAFWIGFSINTLAVEWWLRHRRSRT